MLQHGNSYEEVYRGFRWDVPARFNIGVAACDRHADGTGRLALIYEAPDGRVERFTFDDLKRLSNRCANALAGFGVKAGDRVGVLLPQRPETAIAHLAIYKLGAIAVPLFVQFGPDALEHRLADSGAKVLITDGENLAKIPPGLPDLATILIVEGETARSPAVLADTGARPRRVRAGGYRCRRSGADHLYLRHDRKAEGRAPCASRVARASARRAIAARFLPAAGRSLLDAGGLGVDRRPARRAAAEPLFRRAGVGAPRPQIRSGRGLRADRPARRAQRLSAADRAEDDARRCPRRASASGSICARSRAAARRSARTSSPGRSEALGVAVNEFYGQTEANLLVGNCASLYPVRPGSMGRPIPGHRVAVVSDRGRAAAGRRDRDHRGAAARSGHVPRLLEQSGSDRRKIRRRLAA